MLLTHLLNTSLMKKLFSFLCLTLVLSIVNAVTPAKVKKVRNSSPYDTLPAKLVTDYRKLAMLHSITDLDSGRLFFLRYTEDYKLDELIERNDTTNEGLIEFIISHLCDKKPTSNVSLSYGAGCSAFSATTLNGDYIMGRNFDYSHGNEAIAAAIVQTAPKNGLKSVCMVDGYWIGYRQGLWQCFTEIEDTFKVQKVRDLSYVMGFPYLLMDGMNEKGFAIGVLHLDGKPTQQKDSSKPSLMTTVVMRYLLDHATTVEEAVSSLKQFNLFVPQGQGNYHFYMADSLGNHAVIEYVYSEQHQDVRVIDDEYEECKNGQIAVRHKNLGILPNEMKVMRDKHCVSNFYLSPAMAISAKGPVLSKHGRVRYAMMDFVLSQNNETLSEDKAMNLLDFVSQAEDSLEATSHTQWSVVYNLAQKTAMICVNRNYKKQFVFGFDSNNVCIKKK